VNVLRSMLPATAVGMFAAMLAIWLASESRSHAATGSPIMGAWTLNKDLSDQPTTKDSNSGESDRRQGGGGSGYGGRRGGGFGGGMGGRRGGGMSPGGATTSPEDAARIREAIRDEMTPPDHLTIVETESMILVTTPDGRTTRLSADGKKVKDDNTKVERKTKWDGGKLVSEINGLGPAKITETYAYDAETHQLRVTIHRDAGRNQKETTQHRVYDVDTK
jgi:hypothetical protein